MFDDSFTYVTCGRPVLYVSGAMYNGVVVAVVRRAERVARAQSTEVRALRRAAHAHPTYEPSPRPHHLTHRRC